MHTAERKQRGSIGGREDRGGEGLQATVRPCSDCALYRLLPVPVFLSYCEGGDLGAYLKHKKGIPLRDTEILYHFVQMCLALLYMHEKNILHRDLKTQNIFIKNGLIQLGDFGISKALTNSNDFAQTCIGTPYVREATRTEQTCSSASRHVSHSLSCCACSALCVPCVCTALQYMSPELFQNKPYNNKSDVWALGKTGGGRGKNGRASEGARAEAGASAI